MKQSPGVRQEFFKVYESLLKSKEPSKEVWESFFRKYSRRVLEEKIAEVLDWLDRWKPSSQSFSKEKHMLEDLNEEIANDEMNLVDINDMLGRVSRVFEVLKEKYERERSHQNDLLIGVMIGVVFSAIIQIVLHHFGLV